MRSPLVSPLSIPANAVLLDARPNRADYDAGHLRGAFHADLETQLSAAREAGANAAKGGRHPLPPIERWLQQVAAWGIAPSTDVVVYDDQAGANAAARAWWMLRAIGHERVQVLDGGFKAAIAAGLEVTNEVPRSSSAILGVPRGIAEEPRNSEELRGTASWQWPVVDIDRVDALRNDDTWRMLDVRSRERYRGETEPIDPIAGHIPGAINLPFAENLEQGTFKSGAELRAQYESLLGGTPPERLVVHCGSGVTACHTLLALDAAGLHGAALYVGSWGEWCRNEKPRVP